MLKKRKTFFLKSVFSRMKKTYIFCNFVEENYLNIRKFVLNCFSIQNNWKLIIKNSSLSFMYNPTGNIFDIYVIYHSFILFLWEVHIFCLKVLLTLVCVCFTFHINFSFVKVFSSLTKNFSHNFTLIVYFIGILFLTEIVIKIKCLF